MNLVLLGMRAQVGMRDDVICIIYVDWYSMVCQ